MEHEQTATVAFLRAEEAATHLAEQLSQLAEETRRYDSAARSLEEVGASVRALAGAVLATSERAGLVVEAMQKVGAPELIDRVRGIETGLGESEERAKQDVKNLVDRVQRLLNDLGQRLERSGTSQYETMRADGRKMYGAVRILLIVAVLGVLLSGAALAVSIRNAMTQNKTISTGQP